MRLKLAAAALLCWLVIIPGGFALARETRQGDQCRIGVREDIIGDLFVLCRSLVIDGTVHGNVIGAATTAEINGEVNGALYLVAGQLDVNGTIHDSLHFIGPALRIHSDAIFTDMDADILAASLSTTLDAQMRLPGSVTGVGYQLVIEGEVGDEVNFWGSALQVSGHIHGAVTAAVGDSQSTGVAELQTLLTLLPVDIDLVQPGLRISENAQIDGQLSYSAPSEGAIDAQLALPPQFTQVITQPDLTQITAITEPENAGRELALFAGQVLREFVTLFLVGSLAYLLLPGVVQPPLRSLAARPLPSLGLGLLTFIISFPTFAILVIFSLMIVFALGLLQLGDVTFAGAVLFSAANLSLISLFYFVAIFVSRTLVCFGLGRLLARLARFPAGTRSSAYIHLALGALLLAFMFALPVIGWFVSAIAAFLGLGAILANLQGQLEARRRASYARVSGAVVLPTRPEEAHQFPPPMLNGGAVAPGMDNLPVGFRWWDDG